MVQLLSEWMETFPYDFRDERVMQHVRQLTQRCVALDPSLRRDVSQMLHNLLHRLTALEKYEEFLEKINTEASAALIDTLNVVCNPFILLLYVMKFYARQLMLFVCFFFLNFLFFQCDVTEVCSSPLTLSQQLTHIELERLSFIGPEEFVQAFAKENPNVETSFKDMKKTRNLESYIQWFNRLSYFVATQVCSVRYAEITLPRPDRVTLVNDVAFHHLITWFFGWIVLLIISGFPIWNFTECQEEATHQSH